ncbi:hypothetical protein ACFQ58_02350 [Agromyces sp. NPDC056523]|uniref:hypothetical protein n=1 Tax=Agromyces sp. NPDC056523 TaxID=3345850 RepID=UPI0036724950
MPASMAGNEMNNRITDDEAAALFRGRTPHAREELSPLAATFAEFRASSFGTPPRPSAAVASRLDLERVPSGANPRHAGVSAAQVPLAARVAAGAASSRGAGLGLAARIAIGSAVVVALGLTGAGAAGAAGVLPAPAQEVFEQVTHADPAPSVVGEAGVDDSGSAPENVATSGADHTADDSGATSGGHDTNEDESSPGSGGSSGDQSPRADEDSDEDAGGNAPQGSGTATGKGAGVPAGRQDAGPPPGHGAGEDQDQTGDDSDDDEQGDAKDVAGD